MPHVAGRTMLLMGSDFKRGDVVPEDLIATIPDRRRDALKRTGLLREVVELPPEAEEAAEGEVCPQCGEGPFSRLARHIAAKHEDFEGVTDGD